MQGVFEDQVEQQDPAAALKRSRLDQTLDQKLDAVANNAPWRNLLPANDKDTLQRMREHREREVKYNARMEEDKKKVPRVHPYPELPDMIFPGTPCYRVASGGKYVYVFILDPASVGYARAWDGAQRVQTKGYWIVPHFIYRNDKEVEERKKRWATAYDEAAKNDQPMPSKTDFDSLGKTHDCYYEPGSSNTDSDAPSITDPLFDPDFNQNAAYKDNEKVKPYPYNQNRSEFPQRAAPTLVPTGEYIDNTSIPKYHEPHASLLECTPPRYKGMTGIDWIVCNTSNFEIGALYLKTICERAEEMDYLFAQSMQGLRGTNISAVWTCTDPEYDVTDRSTVLAQFVKMYMEKFYTHVSVMGSTDVEEVVHEALRLHEEFCKGWVHRHHRTLASEVNAASEALVGLYYDELKTMFPPNINPTRSHISRFLRRHPDYCGEFAFCLYHYMTSLEHMRGNRNPSYKAMNNERAAQITSMRKMSEMLFEGGNRAKLTRLFSECRNGGDLLFNVNYIDWHYIAAQMPQHHKEFEGYTNSFNLYRSRTGGRANAFPPWQQMRRVA